MADPTETLARTLNAWRTAEGVSMRELAERISRLSGTTVSPMWVSRKLAQGGETLFTPPTEAAINPAAIAIALALGRGEDDLWQALQDPPTDAPPEGTDPSC